MMIMIKNKNVMIIMMIRYQEYKIWNMNFFRLSLQSLRRTTCIDPN